jgi:hypothetical protein
VAFRIGLDLDGVCYDWDAHARDLLRARIARRGDPVPPVLHEVSRHWNAISEMVAAEDWRWLWAEAEGLFSGSSCLPGTVPGVRALCALGEVTVITSRPRRAWHETTTWLARVLADAPVRGVHFVGSDSKSVVACDVYVDDSPEVLHDLARRGCRTVAMLQPWTSGNGWGPPPEPHARTWDEIVAHVAAIRAEVLGA